VKGVCHTSTGQTNPADPTTHTPEGQRPGEPQAGGRSSARRGTRTRRPPREAGPKGRPAPRKRSTRALPSHTHLVTWEPRQKMRTLKTPNHEGSGGNAGTQTLGDRSLGNTRGQKLRKPQGRTRLRSWPKIPAGTPSWNGIGKEDKGPCTGMTQNCYVRTSRARHRGDDATRPPDHPTRPHDPQTETQT
jgi:hypothetical protein